MIRGAWSIVGRMPARRALRCTILSVLLVSVPITAMASFSPGEVVVATTNAQLGHPGNAMAWVFNGDGTLQGGIAGSFSGNPHAVAFDPRQRLYLATSKLTSGPVTEIYESRLGEALQRPIASIGYAFNPDGSFFVASGAQRIDKYSSSGVLLRSYSIPHRFPRALALAADRCTLYFFDEGGGGSIGQHDVCADVAGPDVVSSPPGIDGAPRSLRLLPDGSLLINAGDWMTSGRAVRYSPGGQLLRTYVVPGFDGVWLAIALTVNGREVWAGLSGDVDGMGDRLYRLDLASGAVLAGPFLLQQGGYRASSLAVAGEYQAAVAAATAIPTLSSVACAAVIAILASVALRQLG